MGGVGWGGVGWERSTNSVFSVAHLRTCKRRSDTTTHVDTILLVALPLLHPPCAPFTSFAPSLPGVCVQLTTGAGPNITKAGAYSAAETYSPSDIADLVTYATAHGVQLMYVDEGKERWREMESEVLPFTRVLACTNGSTVPSPFTLFIHLPFSPFPFHILLPSSPSTAFVHRLCSPSLFTVFVHRLRSKTGDRHPRSLEGHRYVGRAGRDRVLCAGKWIYHIYI